MIVIQGKKPAYLEFNEVVRAPDGLPPPLVFDAPAIFDCDYPFASFTPANLNKLSAFVANDFQRLRSV